MTNDRRQTGIHKLVMEDGNGGTEVGWVIQNRIKAPQVIIGTVIAMIGLLVTVGTVAFNATKAGVGVQVNEEIRKESDQENGLIRQRIDHEIIEHEIESERKLNKTLDEIQKGITRIETKQEAVCDRLERLERD